MNKMSELSVRRSYTVADFQASTEERYNIQGHAAVFNQLVNIGGWFNEIIERGAFDGCDFSDVSLFVNHETNQIPLAHSRPSQSSSTMELEVDEIGLFIRANVDIENNTEAKKLHSSITRGDLDGMSFMFRIKEQKWENLDTDMPTRRILKIGKVYEVSAVNYPAYDQTDISARDQTDLELAKQTLEEARSKEKPTNQVEIERLKIQILMKG